MSSSPETNSAPPTEQQAYENAWSAIYELIDSGKSWSGYERNCAFLNTAALQGQETVFADVSAAAALDLPDDARAVAVTDWDGDGRVDLWVTNRTAPRLRFLRNLTTPQHPVLQVLLEGTRCHRDAFGARVTLQRAGERSLIRTLHAGDGYLAQSTRWLHFGLGSHASIDTLTVRWPGGETETFTGASSAGRYILRQGSGKAEAFTGALLSLQLTSPKISLPPPERSIRTWIQGRVPFPDVSYFDWQGKNRTLTEHAGSPLLVHLWSATCLPCLHELREWSDQSENLTTAKLRMLALSVDTDSPDDSRSLAAQFPADWHSGLASTGLVNAMEIVHRAYLERRELLPVPCSMLLDPSGRVAAVYKGPLASAQLIADTALLASKAREQRDAAVPFPGRWITQPLPPNPRPILATFVQAGQWDAAEAYAQRCLSDSTLLQGPDGPGLTTDLYRILGDLHLDRNQGAQAAAAYAKLADLFPANGPLHRELGQQLLAKQLTGPALRHLALAAAATPADTELRLNLALLLLREGRPAEAIPHFEAVLEARPDLVAVRFQLAQSLERTGAYAKAAAHLLLILDQKSDPAAAVRLAFLLASNPDPRLRNGPEAVRLAEPIASAEDAKPDSLAALAAAYAESGRFEEAVECVDRALLLPGVRDNAAVEDALRQQSASYRARQPWRLPAP